MRRLVQSMVMRKLGGNRHRVNPDSGALPRNLARPASAAVIGGGIAGLTAAAVLAERGFRVTLMERRGWLGGKAGSWTETLGDGFTARIDHGFHGFFRQYFNLKGFMEKTGAARWLVPIDDYRILLADGRSFAFRDVERTPLLNMLSLRKAGVYRLGDMARNPRSGRLLSFLRYHPRHTFEQWDGVSFERFAEEAAIPPAMRKMFTTFSRSFFADSEIMSSAELMKSFHYYFLSNDLGLLYDYLATDFETGFTGPARRYLESLGVALRCSQGVQRVHPTASGLGVDGAAFDAVVLAADVESSKAILRQSDDILRRDPETWERMQSVGASQGYAVLKVWTDRPTREKVPVFVATERVRLLDSITQNHAVDPSAAAWARETGGGVFELHCYALPHGLSNAEIREGLVQELARCLPDLAGVRVVHEHLQVNRDFTAFHVGMNARRPRTDTAIPGLVLAGDWVKLAVPAMLMEAACTSGVFAANRLLEDRGLCPEPIWSVPAKGVLAS